MPSDNNGPLAGIRVLDLTTVQMGPWCTRILSDFGADVIKVEAPEGDSSRYTGIPRHRGMSGTFQHNGRGKRSIALDLKQTEARDVILRLAPGADAFASNIRPAALARLGLDYESIRKINPSIVYLSMVGYGSAGRYAGRPAYDDLIQAAAAIPMLLQRSTGQPRFIPMAAIDRIVGSAAANALLAGLLAKARTGIGQQIEVPMFETIAQFVLSEHMQGQTFDPPTSPAGYPRTLSQHRRPYPTKDGYIAALPYNDGQWRRFFEAVGKADMLKTDPRFADITSRTANIDSLYEMIGEELKHRTTAEWLDLLERNDIPCMRPHTLESLMEDPHLADANFFHWIDHPSEGRIRTMREPSTWSETKPPTGRFAPRLGQHTREILAEAGFDPQSIDDLIVRKIGKTD
ncbi:MAG TPA: CoA transferase [Rhodopila sp.]|jgi:crotonobetainyl-CoA:carnitine CoA-transferase CaiB-like acyl-CoA transferase|nr:CoA transferase [Rhodopila sp.]